MLKTRRWLRPGAVWILGAFAAIGLALVVLVPSGGAVEAQEPPTAERSKDEKAIRDLLGGLAADVSVKVSGNDVSGTWTTIVIPDSHPEYDRIKARLGTTSSDARGGYSPVGAAGDCSDKGAQSGGTQPISLTTLAFQSRTINCLVGVSGLGSAIVGTGTGTWGAISVNLFSGVVRTAQEFTACVGFAQCLSVSVYNPATNFYVQSMSLSWAGVIFSFDAQCFGT